MKKLYFLIAFLMLSAGALLGQSISVKSFKALPMDMTASSLEGKRIDQNGDVAALIKVVTTETGFVFEGGTLGIVDTKQTPGEVWVWVPKAARKITIKHPKLGVLRDYYYPIVIEPERTYEMVLTTAKIETIVKEEVRQQYLIFELEPKNATLEVNDQLWSVDANGTALQFVDLGTYTYRVRAANYETDAGVVTVDDPDPDHPKTVKVKLKSNFAEVTLTVDADAEIWVNNDKKGVRSWTGSLGKGTYKIECKQEGHETSMISREITAEMNGQTITLPAPRPIYGSLNVESTPIGATIYIDGKEIGKTPRYIDEVLIGQRALRLVKEGYEEYSETVTITKGERKQVKATLTTSGRDVRFVCSAPYSQLKIDGQNMGSASGTYKLQDGRHSIFVTADGYLDFSGYVDVDANANYFTIDMQPKNKDTQPTLETTTYSSGGSDKTLINIDIATCEDLIKAFSSKMSEVPNDVSLFRQIVIIFDQKDCTDSKLFNNAVNRLNELDPSCPEANYGLGIMNFKNKNYNNAAILFGKATKTENNDLKYRAYRNMAFCYENLGNFSKARDIYRRAAQVDPTNGEPYLLIAMLYAGSSKQFSGDIESKAVYWAAVDKCVKAKSIDPSIADRANSLIRSYTSAFPSMETIFFNDYSEGQSFQVGGWIDEMTTIRARK